MASPPPLPPSVSQQQPPHTVLVSSMASPPISDQNFSQKTNENTPNSQSQPTPTSTSATTPPFVNDILANINWDMPTSTMDQSIDKIPIQRLKTSYNNNQSTVNTSTMNLSTNMHPGGKQKKTAHNAIERRYRNNINDRITELKNAVPALLHAKLKDRTQNNSNGGNNSKRSRMDDEDDELGDDEEEYLDGVAIATKLNKATILRKATEYIAHLKRSVNDMRHENDSLQHILSQLPGGNEVLAHYRIQKSQREQMLQRQLIMERQLMKQEQKLRKKEASKRKRAKRQYNNNSQDDDYDDGSLSSNSTEHPPTPPSTGGRVFMAIFMAISFFSSSPLTTSVGSGQVNNHHHVSRTSSEKMNSETIVNSNESFNSYNAINNQVNNNWISFEDGWAILRLLLFIACMVQLLFPYFKYWIFGNTIKVRRATTHSKLDHQRNQRRNNRMKNLNFNSNNSPNNKKSLPTMSPGDEKCMQMYQILAKMILTEHDDDNVRITSKYRFQLLFSILKETVQFTIRHVFGYDIVYNGDNDNDTNLDDLDDDEYEERQKQICSHVFKWIKLNECECLGGNTDTTRLVMLYHSLHMINLVDTLDAKLNDDYFDLEDDTMDADIHRKQLSSMRARAYATAAIQMMLVIPYTFISTRLADYLWALATWDANEEDTWACLTEDDKESNLITVLSTKPAWNETLDVIKNQITAWTSMNVYDLNQKNIKNTKNIKKSSAVAISSSSSLGLSLSENAPALVPTAILSNLYLLDRLESHFRGLIDGMILPSSPSSTTSPGIRQDPSFTMFFAYASSLSLNDDSRRVADWFTLVGATIEALWRHDAERAEQSMMTLVQRVPRAMIVPGFSKRKARYGELDAIGKQQLVHLLAGATLILKQNKQGVMELEIADELRQRKVKKLPNNASDLEATHVEGRIMALAEFAVMLIGLEAWISTWKNQYSWKHHDQDKKNNTANTTTTENNTAPSNNNNSNGDELRLNIEKTTENVRTTTIYLRRMIRRPALASLETQHIIVDRLSRLCRFVEEHNPLYNDDDDEDDDVRFENDIDSAYELSEKEDDHRLLNQPYNQHEKSNSENDRLIRLADKTLSILHGH
ncbi:hypothetical protein BJ944DRAFT_227787 [Cunninghamella echinulata]|nr:hypothetical protein BJ944DRAFT_227787 [Cunninghamella echinulata]